MLLKFKSLFQACFCDFNIIENYIYHHSILFFIVVFCCLKYNVNLLINHRSLWCPWKSAMSIAVSVWTRHSLVMALLQKVFVLLV